MHVRELGVARSVLLNVCLILSVWVVSWALVGLHSVLAHLGRLRGDGNHLRCGLSIFMMLVVN